MTGNPDSSPTVPFLGGNVNGFGDPSDCGANTNCSMHWGKNSFPSYG